MYIGVCSGPGTVVKGGGFTENGAEYRRFEVVMVFMNLDSSATFYFGCPEVYFALKHFWDVFPVQFSPWSLRNVGVCMGNAILAAKPSMCHQILTTPDA